jgi:signal transduction histidine kinase
LRPLAALARELEQIDDRHLKARLATSDQPRELRTAVRKLEELLLRLDASLARERQFTADVSHELRTPLAGLRMVLEGGALSERTPEQYRAALAEGRAFVAQLTTLVEKLLALARAEAGQLEVSSREVDVRAFVDHCWASHADAAAKRSLAFRNTIPEDCTVRTDPDQLRIVVGNLLANAAEYTEAGGWIEVGSGDGIVLDVTDSGPAIPSDQLERIFDRFARADAARAATGTHCGIGLSLSRAICAQLELSLAATCSPEGRVRFRIGYSSSTNLPSSVNVASLRPESLANASS